MRFSAPAAAFFTLASFLGAQQQQPYSEGNVDAFLDAARSNKRPAVVLFNFNLDTG